MTEFVVFTLVGPMGSFGDLAGHERRGSGDWPARSAVLGLVGAALGVQRDDSKAQEVLARWRVAVSILSRGAAFRDFHTVQTVPTARIKRPNTRQEALEALEIGDNPVITRRDYCSDCAFGVALWGGNRLAAIEEALAHPCFTPYLGRKSCPLAAPMAPQVVEEESPIEALARITVPPFLTLDPKRPLLVASDEPLVGGWQEIRWDEPLDRTAWHFGPRTVHLLRPTASERSE